MALRMYALSGQRWSADDPRKRRALKGVEGLLLTDKEVAAYRLPEQQRIQLKDVGRLDYAGMNLVRSSLRVENLVEAEPSQSELHHSINSSMSAYGYLALFTHEIEFRRAAVREKTLDCLNYLFTRQLHCM